MWLLEDTWRLVEDNNYMEVKRVLICLVDRL